MTKLWLCLLWDHDWQGETCQRCGSNQADVENERGLFLRARFETFWWSSVKSFKHKNVDADKKETHAS
jgi:hypothetical protein